MVYDPLIFVHSIGDFSVRDHCVYLDGQGGLIGCQNGADIHAVGQDNAVLITVFSCGGIRDCQCVCRCTAINTRIR